MQNKKKIKSILIAANNYPTETDPVYTFLEQLVKAFARRGVKVTVIAPDRIVKHLLRKTEKHPYKRIYKEGEGSITVIQPRYITLGSRLEHFNQWTAKRTIYNVASQLEETPDVCYGYFWHWGYSIYEYAKENQIPLFVHTGETPVILHQYYSTSELESFTDYVKGVVCNSSYCKQLSTEAKLTVEEKCTVFPNAINTAIFYPHDRMTLRKSQGIKEDDFVVSFVGWFNDNKGSLRLSNAISLLKDKHIKSIFIGGSQSGDTTFEPSCEGIIKMGRIPHAEIPDWLCMSDVFVLPTQHEGCSNGIIEALACGLPIISSDRSFNWDVLNEKNSILIDPMNVEGIAAAIKTLKDDKQKREEMSKAALETAAELTIDKRAEKIITFIESRI